MTFFSWLKTFKQATAIYDKLLSCIPIMSMVFTVGWLAFKPTIKMSTTSKQDSCPQACVQPQVMIHILLLAHVKVFPQSIFDVHQSQAPNELPIVSLSIMVTFIFIWWLRCEASCPLRYDDAFKCENKLSWLHSGHFSKFTEVSTPISDFTPLPLVWAVHGSFKIGITHEISHLLEVWSVIVTPFQL